MTQHEEVQRRLAKIEREPLRALAHAIGEMTMDKIEYGSAANVSGVRSGAYTFSRRRDSLTIFAVDSKYGPLRDHGAWTGGDKPVRAACRRVIKAVKVPKTEIDSILVMSEFSAIAEMATSGIRTKGPMLQRKLARATRAVGGVPVWSSYVIVGLNGAGNIGCAEVHWPQISEQIRDEAYLLQTLIKSGFGAPERAGARVESIEAGILHSPAIGLYMDIVPTVRVVYAPNEKNIGRKPIAYLDRHGRPIEIPRVLPQREAVPMIGRQIPKTNDA